MILPNEQLQFHSATKDLDLSSPRQSPLPFSPLFFALLRLCVSFFLVLSDPTYSTVAVNRKTCAGAPPCSQGR
jgi:hypothetical protein